MYDRKRSLGNRIIESRAFIPSLVVLTFIYVVVMIVTHHDRPPRPCSDYADWSMKDVPARCIKEFQK